MPTDPIVSPDWLQQNLTNPNVRVVDMRGYVVSKPVSPGVEEATYKGAQDEYLASHIPGAVYIDWTRDIIDPNDPVPAQIAPPTLFAEAMSSQGIGDSTHVVAVDHTGGQFATRLWWALRYYGHDSVSVLEGGWNRWLDEDRATEAGPVSVERQTFTPRARPELRATAEQVRTLLNRCDVQLLDARDAGQFTGTRRRGPRGGHIPGALNVPRELFFSETGGFLPLDKVRERFSAAHVELKTPIVAYCNGGVAATFILFNLYRLGVENGCNYDGSWNEWGQRLDLPVETS